MSTTIKPNLPKPGFATNSSEFIKAASGDRFISTAQFYKISGATLKKDGQLQIISNKINDHQSYVVIKESIFSNLDEILLENIGNESALGFVFYKTILPGLKLVNSRTDNVFFINCQCQGTLHISSHSQTNDIIITNDCEFEQILIKESKIKDIEIRDKSQIGRLKIQFSEILDILIFNECHISDLDILERSKAVSINIVRKSQAKKIIIRGGSDCKTINILSDSECFELHIADKSINRWISISENSNCEMLFVTKEGSTSEISIHQSKVNFLQVDSLGQASTLFLNDCSKCQQIIVFNKSQIKEILISEKSEVQKLMINNSSQVGRIEIIDSLVAEINAEEIYVSVILANAEIYFLRFYNCSINTLEWKPGTKGELYIEGGQINHLKLLKTSIIKDAVLSIINTRIYIVQLQECVVNGQLIIRNVRALNMPFNWQPLSEKLNQQQFSIQIALLKEQQIEFEQHLDALSSVFKKSRTPLFRMANCSLNKTEITGSDLREYNIEYCDTKLFDIFISGTELPKDKNIEVYNSIENELPPFKNFEQKILIFNQLKKVAEQKGDVLAAALWHSRAIFYGQRLLKEKIKTANNKKEAESEPLSSTSHRRKIQDRFVKIEQYLEYYGFVFNKLSNNHGVSWFRAFIFIALTSSFIYSLYFLSLNYNKNFSVSGLGEFVGDYFSFLNVAHRLDFMVGKDELNACSKFLDFMGRILITYGIYQFISAFRRHGRKSS